MRFTEISESTTSGSVSTVAMPLGEVQSRTQVAGLEPAEKVMKGKAKKKGPYSNSISEGKVNEEDISEQDIILVPGQGRKMKTGFVPHGQSRVDHEVEMARSDLYSAAKNAKQIHELITSVSEDEGLEGWVQEKIIKANDYLNTVREYLEGKQHQGVDEASYINGKLEDPKSLRWKQTSLSPQEAIAKYGKENVRVEHGVLRNGGDMVEVLVPLGEGAKVDRMVKHIEKSEEKSGKSKKEAENIAWATANKRGMLDNKNKKK